MDIGVQRGENKLGCETDGVGGGVELVEKALIPGIN